MTRILCRSFLTVVFLTTILIEVSAVTWEQLRDQDQAALNVLIEATGFRDWHRTKGWPDGTNPGEDMHGVRGKLINPEESDPEKQKWAVTHLDLKNNNLVGVIPAQLGDLTELQSLEIDNSELEGEIPSSLGSLTQLEFLSFSSNVDNGIPGKDQMKLLSFSIPSSFSNLINLKVMALGGNRISGDLSMLSSMQSLEKIYLYDNKFEGELPDLEGLAELNFINFRNNAFSGSIPDSYWNLKKLRVLLLNNNQLDGGLSSDLGSLVELRDLDLGSNKLTGTIPDSWSGLKKLQFLFLQKNRFQGGIPASMGDLDQALNIDLSQNQLGGDIPQSIGGLPNLLRIQLYQNELTGALPKFESPDLFYVDITDNRVEDVSSVKQIENANLSIAASANNIPADMVEDIKNHVRENKNIRTIGLSQQKTPDIPDLEIEITMKQLTPESASNLTGEQSDTPVVPVSDPGILSRLPRVASGLVADGVTPLLFHIKLRPLNRENDEDIRIAIKEVQGGEVVGGINSRLFTYLPNLDDWFQRTEVTLSNSQTDLFCFLFPIPSDDLILNDALAEIRAQLVISSADDNIELGRQGFRIRKPPVTLVHGMASFGGWGDIFFETLKSQRPRHDNDFLITIKYGQEIDPRSGYVGGDSRPQFDQVYQLRNSNSSYLEMVRLLNNELRHQLDRLRPNWAFTKHDIVAHGYGGVLARFLCLEKPSTILVPEAFSSQKNFYRGRFHRIITIGAPLNGSKLAYYIENMSSELQNKLIDYLPKSSMHPFLVSRRIRYNYNPIGNSYPELNNPKLEFWKIHPDASFHLIAATINQGLSPSNESASISSRILGLANDDSLGDIVLPFGSDGLVDFRSMIGSGVFQSGNNDNRFSRISNRLELAHSDPAEIFQLRPNIFDTETQINSGDIARRVYELLNPVGNQADLFRGFRMQGRYTTERLLPIKLAAQQAKFEFSENADSISHQILPLPQTTNLDGPVFIRLKANELTNRPLAGNIYWRTELFGVGGITPFYTKIVGANENNTEVTIEITVPPLGDLIAYASYSSTDGTTVFLKPTKILSVEPKDSQIRAIQVIPNERTYEIDEPISPMIQLIYEDDTVLTRFPSSGSFESSDPTILDTSEGVSWDALKPGTVTVTGNYRGIEGTTQITVIEPENLERQSISFNNWLRLYFSEEDLTNPQFSLPEFDWDGDGYSHAEEYVFGGNPISLEAATPITPHVEHLDGLSFPTITFQILNTAIDCDLILQRSADLTNWENLFTIKDPDLVQSDLIYSTQDNGLLTSLSIRSPDPLEKERDQFFRFQINLMDGENIGDGIATRIPGLSQYALDSLVAHFDGRSGVEINTHASVLSWTPVDIRGRELQEMKVSTIRHGSDTLDLIKYDGKGKLEFNDTNLSADRMYLEGILRNDETQECTIIWLGNYSAGAPFDTRGTYAYNIGPDDTSHQRDDGKGGFVVEQYNVTTYAGNDITAYDGIPTVWTSVLTANSHSFYANGTNLDLEGSPSNSIRQNANIVIGAYSSSGYDLVGEIQQLLIFDKALNDEDRLLINDYLESLNPTPNP